MAHAFRPVLSSKEGPQMKISVINKDETSRTLKIEVPGEMVAEHY